MNSWDKSDSKNGCCKPSNYTEHVSCDDCSYSEIDVPCKPYYQIDKNDLGLMRRLYKAGTEHRKYLRQIFVSFDITAPLYWWKEFDTYKVGTVANSCSTMHKIHSKEFMLDDFSYEHLSGASLDHIEMLIDWLNNCRKSYVEQKHKEDWWQMIQLLPSSYNQKRTITMNYENAITIIKQRTGHKLDEWNEFVRILGLLPYIHEIMEE